MELSPTTINGAILYWKRFDGRKKLLVSDPLTDIGGMSLARKEVVKWKWVELGSMTGIFDFIYNSFKFFSYIY